MPRSLRAPGVLGALLAPALLLTCITPAMSETVSEPDPPGDALPSVDITSLRVANRPRTLAVRLVIDDLRPHHVYAHVELGTAQDDYAVSTTYEGGQRTVALERYDYEGAVEGEPVPMEPVPCDELQVRIARVEEQLTVRMPQTCLGDDAGTLWVDAFVGDDGVESGDLASLGREVKRGPVRTEQPPPLRPPQSEFTACHARLPEGDVTLGHLILRNSADHPIVIDSIRLRGAVGLRAIRTDLVEIPRIRGIYTSYTVTRGYPPRFAEPKRRRAWRERREVPGARIRPGETLDVIMHVRKTVAGFARVDNRVVDYHDLEGREYTWRDRGTVILRGRDSCF